MRTIVDVVTSRWCSGLASRKARTTELNTSHVAMLSQPKAVAAVIMDAAANARAAARVGEH